MNPIKIIREVMRLLSSFFEILYDIIIIINNTIPKIDKSIINKSENSAVDSIKYH